MFSNKLNFKSLPYSLGKLEVGKSSSSSCTSYVSDKKYGGASPSQTRRAKSVRNLGSLVSKRFRRNGIRTRPDKGKRRPMRIDDTVTSPRSNAFRKHWLRFRLSTFISTRNFSSPLKYNKLPSVSWRISAMNVRLLQRWVKSGESLVKRCSFIVSGDAWWRVAFLYQTRAPTCYSISPLPCSSFVYQQITTPLHYSAISLQFTHKTILYRTVSYIFIYEHIFSL